MSMLERYIEALLFTAGEAVPFADIAQLTQAPEEDVQEAVRELQKFYTDRGITIMTSDTHAQMVTSGSVAMFLGQFTQEGTEELSRAAMETLSIIAYRGPITRYDVDAIRGVDCRRMIRQLFRRGFIRQMKSAERAVHYDVTEEFLLHMGIETKQQLPHFEHLSRSENLEHIVRPLS
jgi:segregation and condensation protein B